MDRSDETCRELIYLLWCASGDSCRRLTYSGAGHAEPCTTIYSGALVVLAWTW